MNKISVCVSIGSCVTSFVVASIPYLQAVALLISIVAGILAFVNKPRGR